MKLIYVTTRDKESALSLAHGLLGEKLIACANILDGMTSVYRWQGEIEENHETVLILKTIDSNVDAVKRYVNTHHEYDVPCILAINIEKANEDFLKWVENSCKVAY